MALSTGWKIGIGAAVVGVGAWIVAALSAKTAKAGTVTKDQPPSGGNVLVPDIHNQIKLVPGDMGTLSMAGIINSNGFYQTEGVVNVYLANGLAGNITKFTSSNPNVYDSAGMVLPSISLGLGYPLHQGTTLMTFTWTDHGTEHTSSFTVVAK